MPAHTDRGEFREAVPGGRARGTKIAALAGVLNRAASGAAPDLSISGPPGPEVSPHSTRR